MERNGGTQEIRYTPAPNPDAPGRLGREEIAYPFYRVRIPLEMRPVPGGPAARAGVRSGDLLLAVDGVNIVNFYELAGAFIFVERPLELTLQRGNGTVVCRVKPEPVPGAPTSWKLGIPFPSESAAMGEPMPDSPAARAGLKAGDVILQRNGEPVADAAGVATLVRETRDDRIVKESFLDRDGKRTNNSLGVGAVLYSYDHQGALEKVTYQDTEGNPVRCIGGYAGYKDVKDQDGATVSRTFLGTDGLATEIAGGYSEIRYIYDEAKQLTATRYYDLNGKQVNQ